MSEDVAAETNPLCDFFREVAARSTLRSRAERLRGAPGVLSIAADDAPGPRSPVIAAAVDVVEDAVKSWTSSIRRRSADGPPPSVFPLAPLSGYGLDGLAPSVASLRLASSVVAAAQWYVEQGRNLVGSHRCRHEQIGGALSAFTRANASAHMMERAASIDFNDWHFAMPDVCAATLFAGEHFRLLVDELLAMMLAELAVPDLFLVAIVDAPPEAFDRPWLRAFAAAQRDITHDRLGFVLACDRTPDSYVNAAMVAHGVLPVTR